MQATLLALLLLIVPFFAFAVSPYSDDEAELLNNNERFARDLELRKKFAFAFAKRSAGDADVLIEARSGPQSLAHEGAGMRFAFAKRRSPKEFARFARASFA
ncbi:hypothetical protein CAEBREN_13921 [Caenorhabditis brenneri]|uniref:CBN-NLP-20 protein n=1 Tax=Caenorhabditis brenneri TaxID=135651 RepID=G0NRS6_CAEBE|nr:CBN-NLP-20 protein [Caenorhabditis brenneri]EGT46570.1 hypothetical protein CAEBREN_13921 [Caenorhabditis brenneri]